jgi:probable rRNA maturation factor
VSKRSARPGTAQAGAAAPLQLAIVGAERHAGLPVRATLRRWVQLALEPAREVARDPAARLALVLVGARAGRRLNREFRARDYATNVLTFAYERKPLLAADIVICVPVVRREAREQGKTLREHLAHLVIHGVLHAQGFDHVRARQAHRMQQRERQLLARLRIADPYAPPAA